MRRLQDATFFVETSGELDSPPASAVREFLVQRGARAVTTAIHPLNPEAGGRHTLERAERGRARRREIRLPSRPPLTFPLDLTVPPGLPRADVYIGFNNLVCLRGLAARGAGRVGKVAYWAVDFVPDRFGAGGLTKVYDALDAHVCRSVDHRFEVSRTALDGRSERHGLGARAAPAAVTPMGAWLDRVPRTAPDAVGRRRIVWIGHMVERQGVGRLVDALGLLASRGVEFEAELAGRGPEEEALREAVRRHGIEDRVRFHGYVSDHRKLEAILAAATVGTAPYDTEVESFTRYADPAKLKAYLAAGLPIVTTDVPPNAHEVAERGGGEVVAFEAEAIAAALERALDPGTWPARREAALALAAEYDWGVIVARALAVLGYTA